MANDDRVHEFLDRPLTGEWPYLWLDATYLKLRQEGRIISVAAIIALAVNPGGRREIIGLSVGPSDAETFLTEFLRSLKGRGLDGVNLVISDAQTDLNEDSILRLIGAVLFEQNDDWQSQHRYKMVEAFGQSDTAQTDPLLGITTQAA